MFYLICFHEGLDKIFGGQLIDGIKIESKLKCKMTNSGLDPIETAITDEFVLYHNGSDLSRQILLID